MNQLSLILAAGALALPSLAAGQQQPVRAVKITPAQKPQQKTQEQLRAQREEKLAKPVFKNAAWIMDFDEARAKAKAEGKWILTYFTRSYSP